MIIVIFLSFRYSNIVFSLQYVFLLAAILITLEEEQSMLLSFLFRVTKKFNSCFEIIT